MARIVRNVCALVFFVCLLLSGTLSTSAAPRTECFDKRCSLYAQQEECHNDLEDPCFVTASDPGFCETYCGEWCSDSPGHTGNEACGAQWLECFCEGPGGDNR